MTNKTQMNQVKLLNEYTGEEIVTWINSKYAKKGNRITVIRENGDETPLMTIKEVYDPQLLQEEVNERSQDYKRTRKASDI